MTFSLRSGRPARWCEHTVLSRPHSALLSVSSGDVFVLKGERSALYPCCESNTCSLIIQHAILPEKATPDRTAGTEKLIKEEETHQKLTGITLQQHFLVLSQARLEVSRTLKKVLVCVFCQKRYDVKYELPEFLEWCPGVKTGPVSVLCLLSKPLGITTEEAKASDGHSLSSWQSRQWNLLCSKSFSCGLHCVLDSQQRAGINHTAEIWNHSGKVELA